MSMRTITHTKRSRSDVLHIETELCIVNIHVGLHDAKGREVTSVEILPDRVGEDGVTPVIDGHINNRVIMPLSEADQAELRG